MRVIAATPISRPSMRWREPSARPGATRSCRVPVATRSSRSRRLARAWPFDRPECRRRAVSVASWPCMAISVRSISFGSILSGMVSFVWPIWLETPVSWSSVRTLASAASGRRDPPTAMESRVPHTQPVASVTRAKERRAPAFSLPPAFLARLSEFWPGVRGSWLTTDCRRAPFRRRIALLKTGRTRNAVDSAGFGSSGRPGFGR